MVDSIVYKSQIQLSQQQTGLEIPQIKCKVHQNSLIECINLNINSKNIIFCLKCAISNNSDLSTTKLVILDDIFSKDSQNIIKNWPPFKDSQLNEQLNNIDFQEDTIKQQIQKIKTQFQQLRQDIIKIVDEHEKKIISHINIIDEQRYNILNIYNKISDREEIKQIFIDQQNNLKELELHLRNIIQQKQKGSVRNEIKIKNMSDSLIQQQNQLSFEHITNATQYILQNLKQINFLSLFANDLQQPKQYDMANQRVVERIMNIQNVEIDSLIPVHPGNIGQNIIGLVIRLIKLLILFKINKLFNIKLVSLYQIKVYEVEKFTEYFQGRNFNYLKGKIGDKTGNINFIINQNGNYDVQQGKLYQFLQIDNKVSDQGFHYITFCKKSRVFECQMTLSIENIKYQEKDSRSSFEYVKKLQKND